jgi:23S rRNA pseudouridine1911/1915/1917 synthase
MKAAMPTRLELTVPAEAGGRRLDAWLGETLGSGSRALAQRLIDAGTVLVDGRPRPKSFRLRGGERVSAETQLPRPLRRPAAAEPEIAYEDESLLIADKPPGLVVHPAPGHGAVTLVELLAKRGAGEWSPHVVHRLDRDTSGLMLVAKSERVQRQLRELLRRREIEREYIALVKGRPRSRSGTIEAPLGRDRIRRTRMSTRSEKLRPALTHFTVERFVDDFALVRVRLETGRTHQIRAHFAAIGNPICGDPEYGGRGLAGLDRQFLHSARLRLPHPETGAALELESSLPDDLQAALDKLTA